MVKTPLSPQPEENQHTKLIKITDSTKPTLTIYPTLAITKRQK